MSSAVEVMSVAEILKSEGPAAPVLEDSKVQLGEAAWVIEKARGSWSVRFTPVAETSFELLVKLDAEGEPSKAAAEAMALVKKCLEDSRDRLGAADFDQDRQRAT